MLVVGEQPLGLAVQHPFDALLHHALGLAALDYAVAVDMEEPGDRHVAPIADDVDGPVAGVRQVQVGEDVRDVAPSQQGQLVPEVSEGGDVHLGRHQGGGHQVVVH